MTQHDKTEGVVFARLGRPSQDRWEAAVVLEAWGGYESIPAVARGAMLVPRAVTQRAVAKVLEPALVPIQLWNLANTALALVTVALWFGPITSAVGFKAHLLLLAALPVALGLQWALRGRYLDHGTALGGLRQLPGLALSSLIGLLLIPWALFGLAGLAAGLVASIWCAGFLLAHSGQLWIYAVQIVGTSVVINIADGRELATLLGSLFVAVIVIVRRARGDEVPATRASLRACATLALIGAGLGTMVVAGSATVIETPIAWFGLVAITAGAYWAAQAMQDLWTDLPKHLGDTDVATKVGDHSMRSGVLSAMGRIGIATVVTATAPIAFGFGNVDTILLFIGFGAFSGATLLSGFAFEFGSKPLTLYSVYAGTLITVVAALGDPRTALLAGALLTVLTTGAHIATVTRHPDELYATRMLIR